MDRVRFYWHNTSFTVLSYAMMQPWSPDEDDDRPWVYEEAPLSFKDAMRDKIRNG